MKQISLSGVVGWDIYSADLNRKLKEANGEDVEIFIDSVGGSVFEGIKLYNLIKNYKGKKTAILSGICASMGSYIPLACDKVLIEKNAVYMIHNPWSVGVGDYRDMKKQAEILEGLRNLLSDVYITKSGKAEKEIKKIMDEEGWFFGQQIIENKFADAIYEGTIEDVKTVKKEDEDDEGYSMRIKAMAKIMIEEAKDKSKEIDNEDDIKSILNLVSGENVTKQLKTEGKMTLEKLKAEHSEIYNAVFVEGINAEKKRVNAHLALADVASKDIVLNFIKEGKSINDEDVQAEYLKCRLQSDVQKKIAAEKDEETELNTATKPDVQKAKEEEEVKNILAIYERL
jgi:ATP-dependent protease ClpP protease subunit